MLQASELTKLNGTFQPHPLHFPRNLPLKTQRESCGFFFLLKQIQKRKSKGSQDIEKKSCSIFKYPMENREWRMKNGKWSVGNGEWRIENGVWEWN